MSIRIYALSKQLDVDSKVILDTVRQLGIEGKGSSLAPLTEEEVARVRDHLEKNGSPSRSVGIPPTKQMKFPNRERDARNSQFLAVVGAQSFGVGSRNVFPLLCVPDSVQKTTTVDPGEFPNHGQVLLADSRADVDSWQFVLICPRFNPKWQDTTNPNIAKFRVFREDIELFPLTHPIAIQIVAILETDGFDLSQNPIISPKHDVTPYFFVRDKNNSIYGPFARKDSSRMAGLPADRMIRWDYVPMVEGYDYEYDDESDFKQYFSAKFRFISLSQTLGDPVIRSYCFAISNNFLRSRLPEDSGVIQPPVLEIPKDISIPESPKSVVTIAVTETIGVQDSATIILEDFPVAPSPPPTNDDTTANGIIPDDPTQSPIHEEQNHEETPREEEHNDDQESGRNESDVTNHFRSIGMELRKMRRLLTSSLESSNREKRTSPSWDIPPAKIREKRNDKEEENWRLEFIEKGGNDTEPQVFNLLYERLLGLGGHYSKEFFANIYVCLKSFPLNLLSGPPGCGKSTLIRTLAKAIGHEDVLCDISVRRRWSDDRDLLGGYDSFHNRFNPGQTELSRYLACAEKDWEQIKEQNPDEDGYSQAFYMILMDEFNLAQPEYYFSELLQTLDRKQGDRKIKLFGEEGGHTDNQRRVKNTLTINSNVRFWGTINNDETTEQLSPRLLDRSGMIFIKSNIDDRPVYENDKKPGKPDSSECIRADRLVGWMKLQGDEFFEDVKLPPGIEKALKGLKGKVDNEPSRRVLNAVKVYMANAEGIKDVLPEDRAADFAFQQRVLPVLRGRGDDFKKTMDTLAYALRGDGLERSAEHIRLAIKRAEKDGMYGEIDLLGYGE